jgi:hypothetical protein
MWAISVCKITWRDVAVGASDLGHVEVVVMVMVVASGGDKSGEAEVGEEGLESGAEKDVVALDIAVEDGRGAIVVEVSEAVSCPEHDLVPRVPVESRRCLPLIEEHIGQAPIRHVIVEQQPLCPVAAIAQQSHDVAVPDAA